MAPAKYRGAFSNGFQFSLSVGALMANLVNFATQKIKPGWGWRLSLAIAGIPASILTLGAFFLPETPNSLIQRGSDHQKAAAMLQKIRGTGTDIQAELDDLIKASEVAKAADNHRQFRNIIQKRYRPQLVMAIAIPFFQQFTGINVLGFYAPILFRTIGFRESASLLSAVIMGLTGTLSTFVAMMVVDRVGRRRLFIVGGIQMLFTQIVIGGIMAAKMGDHGGLSNGYAYLLLVLISTYAVGFSFSWGPLGWLVPSEIFQLEIRSAGQSITVAVSYLFTFLLAQTLLAILCHFKAGIFFFFAGWAAVMTAFIYLLLPETTNMPIEKMDKVWKEHWFWKGIVADEDGKRQQLNGKVEIGGSL
ncbi:Hexose carrier protein hex6 [Asimina triloba]